MRSVYIQSQNAFASLEGRLNEVRRFVPLAARHANEDVEYVHQLRIATREALAAIDACAPLLPARESQWLIRALKRIRSAAGNARDLDVMLASHYSANTTCRKWLVRFLRRKRASAQRPLIRISKRFNRRKRFDHCIRACLNAIRNIPSHDIVSIVTDRLKVAVEILVQGAPATNASSKILHQFRIKAKPLRYGLEQSGLSNPDSPLHPLYLTTCEIQKRLGIMNDHDVASKLYQHIARKTKSKNRIRVLQRLAKSERVKARKTKKDFQSWWDAVLRDQIWDLDSIGL
jgi:CHAD domain-containing protein